MYTYVKKKKHFLPLCRPERQKSDNFLKIDKRKA